MFFILVSIIVHYVGMHGDIHLYMDKTQLLCTQHLLDKDMCKTYAFFVGTLKLLLKMNATLFVALHDNIHEFSTVSFVVCSTMKWSFLGSTVSVVKWIIIVMPNVWKPLYFCYQTSCITLLKRFIIFLKLASNNQAFLYKSTVVNTTYDPGWIESLHLFKSRQAETKSPSHLRRNPF